MREIEPVCWRRFRSEGEVWIQLERITLYELAEICFLGSARADTTACREHWSPDDPAHGHCAAAALVVQDIFGGTILRASLETMPERYRHMRSHYWNLLPRKAGLRAGPEEPAQKNCVDIEIDITAAQFYGQDRDLVPAGELRTRDYLLGNTDTARRYLLLRKRMEKVEYWGELFLGNHHKDDEMI